MAISLIIKATRRCNIRCSYCHDWRTGKDSQPLPFRHLARLTKESLDAHDEVNFIWHGGEPTLLGIRWFERATALQHLFRRDRSRITNSIQTNATRLDSDWLHFLKANNFSVGVSIDGPIDVHDKQRVDGRQRGTYAAVVAGLKSIRDAGIPYGVLVVVSEAIVCIGAERVYSWLKSEGITSVGFLPQRPDTVGLDAVRKASQSSHFLSRDSYAMFMADLVRIWWIDADRPQIREFETFVNGLVSSKQGVCIYAGSCVGKYFGIDPNGDVYHCDRFIPEEKYRVGNLGSPGEWIDREKLSKIAVHALSDETVSQKCKWYSVCHGGCPHDRHVERSDWVARDHCCGVEPVIAELASLISSSLPPAYRAASDMDVAHAG